MKWHTNSWTFFDENTKLKILKAKLDLLNIPLDGTLEQSTNISANCERTQEIPSEKELRSGYMGERRSADANKITAQHIKLVQRIYNKTDVSVSSLHNQIKS